MKVNRVIFELIYNIYIKNEIQGRKPDKNIFNVY